MSQVKNLFTVVVLQAQVLRVLRGLQAFQALRVFPVQELAQVLRALQALPVLQALRVQELAFPVSGNQQQVPEKEPLSLKAL